MRAIGSSNFDAALVEEAHATADDRGLTPFATEQSEYSWVARDAEAELLPACERLGVGFVPYFPLASGLLTGKYRRGEPAPEGTRLHGRELDESRLARVEQPRDVGARARRLAARGRDRRSRRAARGRVGDRGRDEAGAGARERRGRQLGADGGGARVAPRPRRPGSRPPESSSASERAGVADGVRAAGRSGTSARCRGGSRARPCGAAPRWWCAVDFASPVSSVSSFSEASPFASRRRIRIRASSASARPSASARSCTSRSASSRLLGRVADDPRVAVLAEEQPRPRGEVRREHDARRLRLALVDEPPRGRRDQRVGRELRGERALGRGVRLERSRDLGLGRCEHLAGEAAQDGEEPALRLGRASAAAAARATRRARPA